jgi:predicted dehydrogenase
LYSPKLADVRHPTPVAVIGCGYWGMNYIRVLNELPDAQVTMVCDPRSGRLDEVARRFPRTKLTRHVEEALEGEEVEAAVICTPATTHREVAGHALEAGKHVLVEKPLTVHADEADELIEIADARERVLLTGHTFLYNPGVRRIKELVDGGALGELYYLYARRTNLGPFRNDVNALWDLVPHDVAIFNYLLGATPDWVSAVGARVLGNGHEDVGFVTLAYGNLIAHAHTSWADPHKVREFVVVGSDRRISFNDLDAVERVRVFDRGVKRAADQEPTTFGEHFQVREGDITSPALPGTEPLKHLTGHFLHCVRRGERPQTPGREGRKVVAVMEAVQLSVARNGAPVGVRPAVESAAAARDRVGLRVERVAGRGNEGHVGAAS